LLYLFTWVFEPFKILHLSHTACEAMFFKECGIVINWV
jgi:hypothetical protein